MKLGIDNIKLPESKKRGPLGSLDHVKELGLSGIFFSTALDMSPTLDIGELRDIRAKADELGLYLESGLGKINPYCSAEEPALRAAGDGDIILGFTRMIEAGAAIGCFELWVAPGNFKSEYRGRLANDRFRTDISWEDQLIGIEKVLQKLAPVARAHDAHLNIETHDEITSFEILRLIEKVGANCVGAVFDTANGLQRAEHPVFAAKRLAPYVRQTHIKDAYVGRAPGGLDFQTRPVGGGIVDFETILPILAEANPALHLSLEVAASVADKPRKANPRQCIPIWQPQNSTPTWRWSMHTGNAWHPAGSGLGGLRSQPVRLSELRTSVLWFRGGDRLHQAVVTSHRDDLQGQGDCPDLLYDEQAGGLIA